MSALVDAGTLNDQLARQVIDGVLAGEGDPDAGRRRARPRGGLATTRALSEAVDDGASPRNPDVADKIRAGKVQAVGALVGAVMKATRGQADAARVRALVFATLGVEG